MCNEQEVDSATNLTLQYNDSQKNLNKTANEDDLLRTVKAFKYERS